MGWGWGSLLRSDSLARCEKQKDKHLWTDYSRLDIMHHLRYDGTYRLSWSWVKVLMSVRWCPVCCRDMFHKDLSTATESAAILSTAREMMYFTKTNLKRSYFRFASPPAPPTLERPGHDRFKQLPPPSPKGWNCPCGCPRGSNKSNWTVHQWHFRKSEASFSRSLVSSNRVPPFSCCFQFVLKRSALKKFTTTGAGYGPLPRSNRYAI